VQCLDPKGLELMPSVDSSWCFASKVRCRDLGLRDKGVSSAGCLLRC
jgi:hypothetical protein